MNDKFKVSDSYRQSIEAEAAREQEVVGKITIDSENKLITKLLNTYGSGKLAGKTETDLKKVESDTSSALEYDGTVIVHAEVIDAQGTRKVAVSLPVKANSVELPEDEELKSLINEAEVLALQEENSDIEASLDVTANLSQFKLVDNRDGYLHVFHPSLDLGKPLGVISYDEYTDLQDKEAFFKDALEKQAANPEFVNHYKLTYAGSFNEPEVEVVSEPQPEEPKVEKQAAQEEQEEDKENLFLGRLPDGFEQQRQFSAQKTQADYNRLANTVANALVNHLRNLSYDSVKILSGDFNDEHTSISLTAAVTDSSGEKVITLDVPVNDEKYTLPKKDVVAKIVERTTDLKTRISASIAEETRVNLSAIDENEEWIENETEAALEEPTIEKTAGGDVGGVQFIGPVDVLNIDKHSALAAGVPEDMEIGDVVDIDGFQWKLTSKDKDNLSKEANSGSIWTFTKVTSVAETDED